MFRRLAVTVLMLLVASGASAQSFPTAAHDFCTALLHKDLTSIHTRAILKPFFATDDDLSNFVVHTSIRMKNAGFRDFIVRGCTPGSFSVKGAAADQAFDISGRGKIFFITEHLPLSTHWSEQDGRWYLVMPSVIRNLNE